MVDPKTEYHRLTAELDAIAYKLRTTRLELCQNIERYPFQVSQTVVGILNRQVRMLVKFYQQKALTSK